MKRINIGTSGYNYYHWRGIFYPTELSPKDFFKYYQEIFSTVEINYTFYHFPKKSTMEKWYKEAREGFLYTLKVPRGITHLKKLSNIKEELLRFLDVALCLKEKLGALLFQLPPSFHLTPENLERVKSLKELLPKEVNSAIEFRHKSWFSLKEEFEFLRDGNLCVVTVSSPGLPFVIFNFTKSFYLRFHGKERWYAYDYTEEELKEIYLLIDNLPDDSTIWVYFNNDFDGYAVKNALYLKSLLSCKADQR